MDVSTLLNKLGAAVADAKAKADVVAKQKADLDAVIAERQAKIDKAEHAYAEAKAVADQLQKESRDVLASVLPAPDPRFRVSQ